MSLDGDVLTEDFPEDHRHQRGVFWAWHQLWDGEERLGDGWTLEDFTTEVKRVAARVTERSAHLDAEVGWRSPAVPRRRALPSRRPPRSPSM